MTTDNTQELDGIIALAAQHWVNTISEEGGLKGEEILKLKQSLLDWHNKQVEELLDRLEADVWRRMANTSVITIINDERKVIERIESDE